MCQVKKIMLGRWVWTLQTLGLIELGVDEKLEKSKRLEWIRGSEESKRVQKKRVYQQTALQISSSSGREESSLLKLCGTSLSLDLSILVRTFTASYYNAKHQTDMANRNPNPTLTWPWKPSPDPKKHRWTWEDQPTQRCSIHKKTHTYTPASCECLFLPLWPHFNFQLLICQQF